MKLMMVRCIRMGPISPTDAIARCNLFASLVDTFLIDCDNESVDHHGNTVMHLLLLDEHLGSIHGFEIVLEYLFSQGANDTILNVRLYLTFGIMHVNILFIFFSLISPSLLACWPDPS